MSRALRRPVLRYHGGKWRLARWIIEHFPEHRVYVEPFGGAASVLMRKPRSYAEVYNDRWDTVVNVFQVLRDPETAQRLRDLLELTPFARSEFEETGEIALAAVADPVERARRAVFRSFAGFGSAATNAEYATGFRSNSNRTHTTPAHDWANFPALIPAFVERLRGVVIESRPAVEVMKQHDRSDTLHYCDPPYPHETRNMNRGNAAYAHEMTTEDHRALADVLCGLEGFVVLSGYRCSLYEDLYADWPSVERTGPFADGARHRTEVLWLSPRTAAAVHSKQLELA